MTCYVLTAMLNYMLSPSSSAEQQAYTLSALDVGEMQVRILRRQPTAQGSARTQPEGANPLTVRRCG